MPRSNFLQALVLTSVYVAAGLAWIYFSDEALRRLAVDVESISRLQTLKGAGYVLTTGLLAFFLSWLALSRQSRLIGRLEHYAHYHELTGLPNRRLAEIRLGAALGKALRRETGVGLLALDLDHFGDINESFGHRVGDQLLRAVAARLHEHFSGSATVAHPGADEFLIIVSGVTGRDELVPICQRIQEVLSSHFAVSGLQSIHLTTCVGAAHFPTDANSPTHLLQYAQAALTRAKHRGSNSFSLFEGEMVELARRQVELEARLRNGLANGELAMYFQPIVSGQRLEVVSYEALMRWQPADGPPVPPGEFIPVAENSGLIVMLGDWAIDQVCRQLALWRRAGRNDVSATVNISARQFAAGELPSVVGDCLERHGVPASKLTLEITETLLMEQGRVALVGLERLRRIGVTLALDDFGTGYSSLAYLKTLPVDILKIDRSFIQTLDQADVDRDLVRSVISMARIFGLKVVAEGVETEGQLAVLRELGCDAFQGFLFGRPAPADSILASGAYSDQ